jgi:hypothetical protein
MVPSELRYLARLRPEPPNPPQEDQKMSDTTNPTAPTTIKITPMVWILNVEACTVAECTVVANRRMAPTAKTTILVATPIIAPPVSTRVTPCDVVPTRMASDANPVWAGVPSTAGTPSTADTRRARAVRRCTGCGIGGGASARAFASDEVKDAAELAVGVSSAGFEFDGGRHRHLLGIAWV